MSNYDLTIRQPHHHSDEEASYFEDLSAEDVIGKFNSMNWKQLQILMLQMRGGKAEFTVMDNEAELTMRISLIEMPETGALTFNFDSDIQVEIQQSNLFGLFKYSSMKDVEFEQLNLTASRELLDAFTHQEVDQIREHFLQQDLVAET